MKGMKRMTNILPILADTQASNPAGLGSMLPMILIWVVIIAFMYFFLIRPNSKKKKEEAEMRNSLEIGDEITTIGGIMGRVVAIKDDEDAIIIETGSDRVKMKFKKWCISTVDTVKEKPADSKTEKKSFGLFNRKKNEEQNTSTAKTESDK
jgi:preprotein translocase subunit YajC